jgi:hypothetical protein
LEIVTHIQKKYPSLLQKSFRVEATVGNRLNRYQTQPPHSNDPQLLLTPAFSQLGQSLQ